MNGNIITDSSHETALQCDSLSFLANPEPVGAGHVIGLGLLPGPCCSCRWAADGDCLLQSDSVQLKILSQGIT